MRCLLLCLALIAGCSKEKPASVAEVPKEPPKLGPAITATPNTVPAGPEKAGKTTIAWTTGNPALSGQIYLAVHLADGTSEPEKLFTAGPSGSIDAPWIAKGPRYEFILYEGTEKKTVLARVTVNRE